MVNVRGKKTNKNLPIFAWIPTKDETLIATRKFIKMQF